MIDLRQGDCLELMKDIPNKSIDMILCDLPYGTTANGSKIKMKYYLQGLIPIHKINIDNGTRFGTMAGKRPSHKKETIQEWTNYPFDVLQFESVGKPIHPTQKPVALLEYLIKTYTNEGDVVLDNCMSSGSTGVACVNTNRNFIGIELSEEYYNIAKERIEKNKFGGIV